MKIVKIISFLLFINILSIYAQPKKLIWSAPKIEDLQMKQYNEEPQAPALVLERYVDLYFDDWREELRLIYDFRQRIKILKSQGLKYTHFVIPYIGFDYFEDFAQVKGYIYKLKNNNVQRKKLKRKYISIQKTDKYNYLLTINFPDVEVGDIIELRYSLASFNFVQPRRFYFQDNIPVRYAEFNANIPFFIKYYFDVYTFDAMDVKIQEQTFAQIEWSARYKDPIPSGMYYRGYDFHVNPSFNFHSNYYHLVMKNVPSFYTEPFLDNKYNYYFHVDMKLQQVLRDIGYNNQFLIFLWEQFSKRMYQTTIIGYRPITKLHAANVPYPAGYFIFNANSWNSLAKDLIKEPAFGRELKRFTNVLPIINRIKNKYKDSLDITIALYEWVRDSIKWKGHYDFLITQHLNKTLENKTGNSSADINMLLLYMLRKAGFKADPILIRTLDKGHLLTDLPAFYQFNHVIVGVYINKNIILLDAVSKNPWFILPNKDMNQMGFLISKDTSFLIPIHHPIKPTKSYVIKGSLNKTLQLVGSLDYEIKGLYLQDSSFQEPKINNQIVSLVPDSTKKTNTKLIKQYTFVCDNFVKENDTSFIIYPFRMFIDLKNIFPSYSRTYPIYLGHRFKWEYDLEINFPEKVKKLNFEPIEMSIKGASVKLISTTNKNSTNINLVLDCERYYFDTNEYQDLYSIFDLFENIRNAKIIVPKK